MYTCQVSLYGNLVSVCVCMCVHVCSCVCMSNLLLLIFVHKLMVCIAMVTEPYFDHSEIRSVL